MSTILIGDWPVCDRCEQSGRRYRRIAAVLATVMAANLLVLAILIIAGWAGLEADLQTVVRPLVWAFFPGSIPIGIGVAAWLASRSIAPVVFRPIYDERFAFVQAHPRFRTALQAIPDTRQPDECDDDQTGSGE
ncbi:hypothetical protein [Nocardia arizonensis]|uniref:hypothetical protein n=1 Tax=Nocardia arizonensis TaxID=1141647 RepID=UPI0006D20EF0|nr:hypothetical protein [Nocardia arizonensis]